MFKSVERRVSGMLPHVRIEGRLRRLEHFGMGSSATYVGNNRVLVRVIAGKHALIFYVHADDKLLSPWLIANGQHEGELTDYYVRHLKEDSHCIDVGANFGYFTCIMAKFCPNGRVIGLEPNGVVHELAMDNLLINALHERAEILNMGASDAAGELTLYRRVGRAGNTSIAQMGEQFTRAMGEPAEEAFSVPTVRIDDLRDRLSGRVDHIKIDVEGAEPLAFAGARATIDANPQLQLMMEWAPGQISHAGFDLAQFCRDIAAARLQPFVFDKRRFQPISHAELVNLPYQPGVLLHRIA